MKLLVIDANEEYRIDRLIIRAYGVYNWNKIAILKHFNPTLDFLLLTAGTPILIPNDEEIASIRNYKGFYSLVRN